MTKTYIIAADKVVDGQGSLTHVQALLKQLKALDIAVESLFIEPLSSDWQQPSKPGYFKSGCGPLDALFEGKRRLEQGADAVLISGEDLIKSGYDKAERHHKMAVYGDDYPLTAAYTDLAAQFIKARGISEVEFKALCEALFDNYLSSFKLAKGAAFSEDMLPEARWYQPLTKLFRGVDCANPMIDFSGRLLLCREAVLNRLSLDGCLPVEVAAVATCALEHDGPEQIKTIATYHHLAQAYKECLAAAQLDFATEYKDGKALLEVYTCYPVVPLAFLLSSGLVQDPQQLREFLSQHLVTITGGMNLARAPWNNPALNGLISMYQRLCQGPEQFGMVHGNGGLGYRQGVALLQKP